MQASTSSTGKLRRPDVVAASLLAALLASAAPAFSASLDRPLLVVSGDFDGDGSTDKAQGFPEASEGAGRVDVFWGAEEFKVAWPTVLSAIKDPATLLTVGRLGEALAVGDFNGDGLDDLAIGAPHADLSAPIGGARVATQTHAGSVTVIYGCSAPACKAVKSSGAGWPALGSSLDPSGAAGALQIAASPRVPFGRFGKSLAAGDFDADGYDDLAIGAPGDTVDGAPGAGSVTIIEGGANGLDLDTRRRIHQNLAADAPTAEADDHFGAALSAARLDLDDDEDLAVGVPDEDYGAEVNPGEVDVFWGGAAGLRATSYVSFRATTAMAGASRSGDRLGRDLRAADSAVGAPDVPFRFPGALFLGLAEAAGCDGRGGFLAVRAGPFETLSSTADLECDVDIGDAASVPGDGALPEIPVNFIVIANAATVGVDGLSELPDSNWSGFDPITGAAISGADFFKSEIDLLNQQLRADDGNPVCNGKDCLRLAYRSHTTFSPAMFKPSGVNLCPKLHAIAEPSRNAIHESQLAITENCNANTCPRVAAVPGPLEVRFARFSDFAEAAVNECTLLTEDDALNVIVYDLCGRAAGRDGAVNTDDDMLDCANFRNGRARTNDGHPYVFLDYDRALQPRNPATPDPSAMEEHETGHAIGLHHACDPLGSDGVTHVMQSGYDCDESGGDRNLGFATTPRVDFYGNSIVEVEMLVRTAREHSKGWQSR